MPSGRRNGASAGSRALDESRASFDWLARKRQLRHFTRKAPALRERAHSACKRA
jgi:hypothetical protein